MNCAALSQKRTEFIYLFIFGDGSQQKQTFKNARQQTSDLWKPYLSTKMNYGIKPKPIKDMVSRDPKSGRKFKFAGGHF